MKKFITITLIFSIISITSFARKVGETEITTEEGIEVFQNEKYYLLKKNVNIQSDRFKIKANLVKAYFDKDLYDIIKIESEDNVRLRSSKGIIANGEKINFSIKNEDIEVYGERSSLIYNSINMFSNEKIRVNNLTGEFNLEGNESELKTSTIQIFGSIIDGKFITINEINEVQNLYVEDSNQVNIITDNINMFALRAKYNKKENVIELFENVKVIRGNETIIGDYANINTLTESYKVISNDKKKVKAIIINADE